MSQSDELQLVTPGTLHRPGVYGRSARFLLGVACLYALFELVTFRDNIVSQPFSSLPNISVMLVIALCIVNYVVNIGFGVSWKRLPSIVSVAVIGIAMLAAWTVTGSADNEYAGLILWLWLVYFYAHLGFSFVLASIIATPGCEMRAIPELVGKVRRQEVEEHHCPAAFIQKIDDWEMKLNG